MEVPRQLKREEISDELRSLVWFVIHESITRQGTYGRYIDSEWAEIIRDIFVFHELKMVDDFDDDYGIVTSWLKSSLLNSTYGGFYGLIQYLLRHRFVSDQFRDAIKSALERARSPYRVVHGDTLVPIGTQQEAETIERAVQTAVEEGHSGSASHIKKAAQLISEGKWADSVRESVHAVESIARVLKPGTHSLGPALNQLQTTGELHDALKKGMSAMYGYSSDENGIRHALLDEGDAAVDETDAIFMLGACAAFVSYVLGKVAKNLD